KHSYYVIRNSEHLMGFTDREIELIAQVARYHRRSVPSVDKHLEFASLTEADQTVVRSLAGILRIAIGMDRNHDGGVERLEVDDRGDVVCIGVVGRDDADLALETFTAEERAGLLAEQLGAAIEFVIA
ncbi:MAG: exopolyphosphatase, partial [Microthrixaceae bacterium]